MKIQNVDKISFTAIPKANYDILLGAKLKSKLNVVEIEKKDLPLFNSIIKNLNQYEIPIKSIKDKGFNIMFKQAVLDAIALLKSNVNSKAKIFISVVNREICGIMIANTPKQTKNNKILLSARRNASSKEGELDWIITWDTKNKEKVKHQGQILISNLFQEQTKSRFNLNFVRAASEFNPRLEDFYSFIGFKIIGKRLKWNDAGFYPLAIKGQYSEPEDDIITPMIINKKAMRKFINYVDTRFNKQPLEEKSINIKKIIDF